MTFVSVFNTQIFLARMFLEPFDRTDMTLGPLNSFLQHSEDLFSALYGLFAISGGA